ncbi:MULTISPECIES: TolC family outer membrane protein [unclassified Salinicola]|uniref:TolC family outer membrane protein n=1 Tax=unclassified Salinicola TaxID=2634022 RepID=UPI001A8F6EC4|nr:MULTISPECIES: TolC family outer membrane protein [unclassified Salinicola]MCE3027111.1 TolC family outer membrane protein [Salinicola sp. DM10]WIX33735.1 TolC family outer membrane protein [Salinicola sp. JS01]
MRQWILGVGVAALAGSVQAQSLTEAVTQAVMQYPTTRTEMARYQQNLDDARAQRGAYLPSLSLEGRVGYGANESETSGVSQDSDPHSYRRAQLTLSQLIWDGNTTIERIRQADEQSNYQRWQVAAVANQVGLTTIQAYLDVLRSQRLVELAQRNVDTHQRIAADIRRRSDLGAGTATDTIQVDGRMAQAQASLIAARNNLDDATSAFLRYVGETPRNLTLPPAADMSRVPQSFDAAMAMATAQNPLVVAASHSIAAAQHEVAAERGDFLPTFRAEASRLASRDYDFEGDSADDWNADLVMSWNLYRGGIDLAQMRSREDALRAVRYDSDRSLREIRDELRLAWNARDYLTSQLPFLSRHVEASQQTRVNYRKQFDIGRRTLLDMLDSETELYDAERSQVEAEFSLRRANYRLLAATGQLLDTLQVDVGLIADAGESYPSTVTSGPQG